jgi:4-aminobutyrate--pyruvate transaminase
VTSAVALETLKIYEERDLVAHVRKMAPRMQASLQHFADHPLVGEARGIGLIGALELVADKTSKASFDPKANVGGFLASRAHHHGIIIRSLGDNIAFSPPLIINEAEIDLMFERFERALDDTLEMVRERGLIG